MNSVLISVHMNVDRNMGRLVEVLWTELWKRRGVDSQGPAGTPAALATPRASPLPIVGIREAPGVQGTRGDTGDTHWAGRQGRC